MIFAPLFDRYPDFLRPRSAPVALGNAGGLSGARIWRFEAPFEARWRCEAWPQARGRPGPI